MPDRSKMKKKVIELRDIMFLLNISLGREEFFECTNCRSRRRTSRKCRDIPWTDGPKQIKQQSIAVLVKIRWRSKFWKAISHMFLITRPSGGESSLIMVLYGERKSAKIWAEISLDRKLWIQCVKNVANVGSGLYSYFFPPWASFFSRRKSVTLHRL